MNFPVFDLHCDTALALLGENLRTCGSLKENQGHIDLKRASKLPGYAQCFACFTTENLWQIPPVEVFERELATIQREIERNSSTICLAYSAADVESNLKEKVMSAVLTIEGPAGFGYDPALLEDLYLVGFRMSTLSWNESNSLTGSCVTGGGLTDLGREYVKEAQRLGMIIDVSHISDEAFWDIIGCSNAPVVASHSNSRTVCDVPRNLTDDMFRSICQTGGVAGMNLYTAFVGGEQGIRDLCDHVLHFLEMDPEAKHIAIGGDLDGCDTLVTGVGGIDDYPLIAQALHDRGLTDEMLQNIFWNNALGVMKSCCI